MNTPINRNLNGDMIYANQKIDLTTKPSTEYSVKYKQLSVTYVNNHDYQDEFFVMAKGRFTF